MKWINFQNLFAENVYYGDPNNSRERNNSREWQNIHILITVGCGIMVGCGKKLPKKNNGPF